MKYSEIKAAAQAYTDRYDDELVDAIDSFTKIVEGKINNALRTGEQSVRGQIWLERDQEYYGLPFDWGGFRDVEILSDGKRTGGRTLTYLAPEEMNKLSRSDRHHRHNYYTIIANQIQVAPPTDNEVLEVVYYQRLPSLVPVKAEAGQIIIIGEPDGATNWLTEKNPDAYIFGLCAEICAFAKDAEGFTIYDGRFKEALANITQEDQVSRWSGPALRVQVEGLCV
jgi:hypothetical protein